MLVYLHADVKISKMIDEKIFGEDLLKFLKDVLNLCNKNSDKLNYDDEKFPVFYSDGKYKKFEIKKKIFTEYDYDFSKYDSKLKENSTDFKILRNYILFAAICIQKFQDNNNLKFLNVLLKLNDIICSQIDSISDAHDLSLVYHVINLELEYVSDLNRKTL